MCRITSVSLPLPNILLERMTTNPSRPDVENLPAVRSELSMTRAVIERASTVTT